MYGFMTVMCIGLVLFGMGLVGMLGCVLDRIHPEGNDQPLITVCQVDERIIKCLGKSEKEKPELSGGYFIDSEGIQRDCEFIEAHDDKVKIRYLSYPHEWSKYLRDETDVKWIDKKDYFLYASLKQLNKKVNEIKSKKSSKKS